MIVVVQIINSELTTESNPVEQHEHFSSNRYYFRPYSAAVTFHLRTKVRSSGFEFSFFIPV